MSNMDKFVHSIKDKYRERRINREKQWPPCHSNKLINLELVERRKGESYLDNQPRGKETENAKRTPLAYDQLFEGEKRVRKILVEGDAGIGKTTLSISISEDWANGKLFQQFELVLLLPLRLKEVAFAGSLCELLKILHSSSKICDAVVSYLDEEEGKKVLIIADGWDELTESKQVENSFLYKLLFERFPFLSVIITSRPSGSAQLCNLPHIDRFIEVHGFHKDNIKEYIQSEFTDNQAKAEHLIKQLECNPLIESVCSIPLSCAIVCHLWHVTEERLPTNLTQLYTKIILNIILRNIKKIDTFKEVKSISGFDDIPAKLQGSWWLLCKFALHAMQKDQVVFSQKELDSFSQDLALDRNIFNCFGLLQSADSIVETGCEASFHFLHLTFQEYLSALYLVKQLSNVKLAECSSIVNELKLYQLYRYKKRFAIVWRFFFGIYFREIQGNSDFIVHLYLKLKTVMIYDDELLLLYQCAFEANNDSIVRTLTETSRLDMKPWTSHDYDVFLYIIDNIQKHNNVNLMFKNHRVSENQIKTLANALVDKQDLRVNTLDLGGNWLTDKVVMNLLHKASVPFSSLQCLLLCNNHIGVQTINSIITSSICSLSYLDLSHNPLGIPGLQALRNTVCSGALSKLNKLQLKGSLSNDKSTDQALIEALSTNNCPLLKEVDLSENNLNSPSVMMALARFASSRSWIKSLILSETKLGDHSLNSFIKNLKEQCFILELDLNSNDISGNGMLCLADGVCSGKINVANSDSLRGDDDSAYIFSRYGIYLDDNLLGLEGTVAVGKILSSDHNQSRSLSLSRCQLTSSSDSIGSILLDILAFGDETQSGKEVMNVGQYLTQLPQNDCLSGLGLNGNSFSGDGIHVLSGLLHLCPCLTSLDTKDCGINSDDLHQLIKNLEVANPSTFHRPCSKLVTWDLDDNNIDDRGILLLSNHLSLLFPLLGNGNCPMGITFAYLMDFRGNPVSYEAVKRFKEKKFGKYYCSRSSTPILGKTTDDSIEIEQKVAEKFIIWVTTPSDCAMSTRTVNEGPNITEILLTDDSSIESESLNDENGRCTSVEPPLETDDTENPLLLCPPKKPRRIDKDVSSLPVVEHHLLDLLKWEDENGTIRELQTYTKIAHKWNKIATRLGFEPGKISSIQKNYSDDGDRVTATFKVWFENAVHLPNALEYPKSWQGLIKLLNDSELGEVAIVLRTALSSPKNSVRNNL